MTLFQILLLGISCLFLIALLVIFFLFYIKYLTRKPKNEKDEESLLYDFLYNDISHILDFNRYDCSYLVSVLHYPDRKNNLFIDTFIEIRSKTHKLLRIKNKHFFDYKKFIEIDDIKFIIEKYNFLLILQISRYKLMKFDLDNFLSNDIKDKQQLNFYYDSLKDLKGIDKYILPNFKYYYFKTSMVELKKVAKECNDLFNNIKRTIK